MEFDKYAESYDSSFMGKGSGIFYSDLIKELDINPIMVLEIFTENDLYESVKYLRKKGVINEN